MSEAVRGAKALLPWGLGGGLVLGRHLAQWDRKLSCAFLVPYLGVPTCLVFPTLLVHPLVLLLSFLVSPLP